MTKNKIWLLLLIGLTLTGYVVFSINKDELSVKSSPDSQPRHGGKLVVGISNDVDTFNPLFAETALAQEINHLLLVGLADLNDKSEFVPEIAISWERSDDYLELTYHLRKDAVWSDGVPVTAEDVKFTYDLLKDDEVASPRQDVTEYIKQVVVQDSHTVTFEFSEPYPDQIYDTAGEILPKHILQDVDRSALRSHDFGRNPISSGPFVLQKWISQEYFELVPNENFYGGRAYLDRVIFKVIPDKTSLLLQLKTGEIDMFDGVPPEEAGRLQEENPHIRIYPISGRVYYYVGYNLNNPLFADSVVRRALTMAIDRQAIIDALLYGFGEPCLGHVPPMISWAYNDKIAEIPFHPEKARELLSGDGWRDHDGNGWLDKDGREFTFTLKTNAGNQLRSDAAIIIQDQLMKIGVKVDIQTLETATLIQQLRRQEFDAYMGGWSASLNIDLTPIFHSQSDDLFNFVNYRNSKVDSLIEVGREEMDGQKAARVWKKAQQLIYEDQPYTFLFWKARIIAVNDRFKNVTPIPLSALYRLEHWYQPSE